MSKITVNQQDIAVFLGIDNLLTWAYNFTYTEFDEMLKAFPKHIKEDMIHIFDEMESNRKGNLTPALLFEFYWKLNSDSKFYLNAYLKEHYQKENEQAEDFLKTNSSSLGVADLMKG